jgi:formylglycine-generating enzyme
VVIGLLCQVKELPSWVDIRAGTYRVGKADRLDRPVRKVKIGAFRLAKFETTNQQFLAFVEATKYVTDAERRHDTMVFEPGLKEFRWIHDPTAFWKFPNGKSRGGIGGKMNHPVTSISFRDALAYCKWAKVRLPTLDEWEIACRAGTRSDYFFGADGTLIGQYANVWHGRDHLTPDTSDGYLYTSPVGSFLPNPLGLYDMYGNVFEFCSGRLGSDKRLATKHSRGGSWWCSSHACCAFNSVDIGSVNERASFSNQGFRVVL